MLAEVKTVFLDRDGVINRKLPEGEYVGSIEHFELLAGSVEAISRLSQAGLKVVLVTNQQGIGKGTVGAEQVDEIHQFLCERVEAAGGTLDQVQVCPHIEGSCECRKPSRGLFEMARASDPAIAFDQSVVVGDSVSDIEAARGIGASAIRIAPPGTVDADADAVVTDLSAAAKLIMEVARA